MLNCLIVYLSLDNFHNQLTFNHLRLNRSIVNPKFKIVNPTNSQLSTINSPLSSNPSPKRPDTQVFSERDDLLITKIEFPPHIDVFFMVLAGPFRFAVGHPNPNRQELCINFAGCIDLKKQAVEILDMDIFAFTLQLGYIYAPQFGSVLFQF